MVDTFNIEKAIEVKEASYTYPDGTLGVRNANLFVRRGESVALVGPNGSGKSTLLKVIDGLLVPKEGNIWVLGQNLSRTNVRSLRKNLGFLFSNPEDMLFSNTLREDIEFGPAQLGISKEEVERKTEELAALFGLKNLLDKPPFRLSEGEKQRGALASILALDPEILLLDEPTSRVDASSKSMVISLIQQLNSQGKTVLTASNDLDIIPYIASRVYLLGPNKEVVADGEVKALLKDKALLQANGLEPPIIVRLFHSLNSERIPLTVQEASKFIRGMLSAKEG